MFYNPFKKIKELEKDINTMERYHRETLQDLLKLRESYYNLQSDYVKKMLLNRTLKLLLISNLLLTLLLILFLIGFVTNF